jgi:hypothetical protein
MLPHNKQEAYGFISRRLLHRDVVGLYRHMKREKERLVVSCGT